MAEHRRVEPRGIVGTGMATDPEKIREVEHDYDRGARAWRNPPERGFGEVLADAPARGVFEGDADDAAPDGRNHKPALDPERAPDEAKMSADALDPKKPAAARSTPAAPSKPLPRVPPDPREAALRQKLARSQGAPRAATNLDTPPTGKTRKPT